MADRESAELKSFVLSCLQAIGALVDTPSYNLVEVVLPDEYAAELGKPAFLRLAFSQEVAEAHPDAEYVTYGSPLVEGLIELARRRGLAIRWYINDVRLSKPGLFEIAKKSIGFTNARLVPLEEAADRRMCFYYLLFNFKVSYISDEKQEALVPVLMNLNTGQPAHELQENWSGVMLDAERRFPEMADAPLFWRGRENPALQPLSEESLEELYRRAARAVERRIAPTIASLQRRAARHLKLDRARINGFYDDLRAELERRLERARRSATDEAAFEEKRRRIEEKLAAVELERRQKLADVEAKYRLRVVLDLINVALIAQPKLVTTVGVKNRYASTTLALVWDPLLHRLEPPLCQVCKLPTSRLHLCANGHLACDDCILKCSACKREYCRLCEDFMGACSVCGRPLCARSQIKCQVCGRITCEEHRGMCH